MNPNYTTEQVEDIKQRTQQVIDLCKTLELEIQAQVVAMDTGDNIFGKTYRLKMLTSFVNG